MLHIIWHIIVGFVVGLVARAVMPGAQAMGLVKTTLLGIVGGVVGGLIGRLFSKPEPGSAFHPAGFIMSVMAPLLSSFFGRDWRQPGSVGNEDSRFHKRRGSARTGARLRGSHGSAFAIPPLRPHRRGFDLSG